MAGTLEKPVLHVEGIDDQHSIVHLLTRHGISFEPATRLVDIKVQGNDVKVLEAMPTAVRASTNRAVGFVIDADVVVPDRWAQVCARLRPLGLVLPEAAPAAGYIGELTALRSRVGIWLMPDNVMDFGKLEDLLKTLVPPGDPIIAHAEASTDAASDRGALFAAKDRIKAVMHTWLAWQKKPGVPFGIALQAEFFSKDSAAALRFVEWFRHLYHIF